MNSNMKSWNGGDFDQMGWHDNHVHGFFIRQGEHGTGELILDIDYILEWKLDSQKKHYTYLIAPATLTFNEMHSLKLELDYVSPSAGICPFSIQGIERETKVFPNGYSSYLWRIPINFPSGQISFIASNFHQVLRAEPIWNGEWLDASQRASIIYP